MILSAFLCAHYNLKNKRGRNKWGRNKWGRGRNKCGINGVGVKFTFALCRLMFMAEASVSRGHKIGLRCVRNTMSLAWMDKWNKWGRGRIYICFMPFKVHGINERKRRS